MKTKILLISMIWISLTCFSQNTFVPDNNFEQALIDLGYDSGSLDDYVPTANINTITILNIAFLNIKDLTGIRDFVSLTELVCIGNQLTSLDVSNNVYLKILECGWNYITSLDLSNNSDLKILLCFNNQLTSLNLKNGNNLDIIFFSAISNPDLYCIDVDDKSYSIANWTSFIDPQSIFSEDCSALSINKIETNTFKIHPNPVKDILIINSIENINYSMISLDGQIIRIGKTIKGESTLILSNLSNGLYFLKVKTDDGFVTKKLLKQ